MILLVIATSLFGTVSARADMLGDAMQIATGMGFPPPEGWNVQLGTSPAGAPGQAIAECSLIILDPAVIDAMAPGSVSADVLAIVYIHERFHVTVEIQHGLPADPCREITIQVSTSGYNCDRVDDINESGGDSSQACGFYNAHRDGFNGGGAAKMHTAGNCSGAVPSIPECPGCN